MQHDKIKPILFSVIKHSSKEELKKQLPKDIVSGIVVAVVALPLSIALAIASGVGPEAGLYTAIVAGFLIAFLGGSRVQISGPTAAFATIVAGIVATDGLDGLFAATIIAGVVLILMGVFKLGALIRFVPYTITTGFTAGIAVTIVIGQIKDLLGLTYPSGTPTVETTDKIQAVVQNIATINTESVLVGLVCLVVLFLWPKFNRKIPSSLIAIFVGIGMVNLLGMNVNTIGDLYTISSALPELHIPQLSTELFREELANGFTIAMLAAIESLLSCVVADSMISSHHRCNMELVAQGVGNIGSILFGGIPATGAIARTAANVDNGGRTPHLWHGSCRCPATYAGIPYALCSIDSHAYHCSNPAAGCLQHVGLAQLRAPLQNRIKGRRGNAFAHLHPNHRIRPGYCYRHWHDHHYRTVHEDGQRRNRG